MKKVLSLVLAFAMILGSFGFVFASDFPDVKDTEYYSEPVNVLSGLGVIGGFTDGTYRPDSEVTRAQMATMIVNALGMTVTGKTDTKFTDVKAAYWASGFINYAASVGFIAGYPDGTFKPDDKVTYDQALTMIVAALGYKADALTGSWPGNFVNQARGLGILDTCKTTGSADAPRKDIACFLYDALTAYIGITDKDGAFHPTEVAKDEYDCMMSRLGAKPFDKDGADAATYKAGDAFVVDGSESSIINLSNYLGAFITAYANKDGKIVAVKEVKSQYIEDTYSQLKKDYNFDKAKEYTDKDGFVYFENGDVNTAKGYADIDGKVKLAVELDGKKVGAVYSAQIWEADKTIQFTKDDADEIVDAKTLANEKFAQDDDKEIDTAEFELVGADTLADIPEDAVVSIYVSKKDNTITKIEVSTKTIEGVITKKSAKEPFEYTIGGTAYGLNDDMPSAKKTGLDGLMSEETKATFYLDYAGDIFTYESEKPTTSHYAIVLATDVSGETFKEDVSMIRLLLADKTTKDFEVDKKIKDVTDDNGAWKSGWTKGDVAGTTAPILIKYTVDSDDLITDIVKVEGAAGATTKFDDNGLNNKMALTKDTVVFSYDGTKPVSADSYDVLEASDLYGATVTSIVAKVSDDKEFEAVLVTGAGTANKSYALFIEKAGSDKNGDLWTALYEGEVKTLSITSGAKTAVEGAKFTTSAASNAVWTLTLNSSGAVKSLDSSKPIDMTADKANTTKTTSVSGNVFTDGAGYKYSLDTNVQIYVCDDDEWTATTNKSAMAGRTTAFEAVYMVNTDDDADIEIVLVLKK